MFVLNYVNHKFEETLDYHDKTYHKKGCTDCGAYVLQEHNNVSATYVNANNHKATFNCCGGVVVNSVPHNDVEIKITSNSRHKTTYHCCGDHSVLSSHTGTLTYTSISSSKHRVQCSCCDGYVTEVHMLESIGGGQKECILCGYISSNLLNVEDEEIA